MHDKTPTANVTDINKYKHQVKKSRAVNIAKAVVILMLAATLGGTLYYFRDELTTENARVVLSYLSPEAIRLRGSLPDEIRFVGDPKNSYGIYKNKFAVLSVDGVRLYSASNSEEQFLPMSYQKPIMQATDKYILTYDMGNSLLSVINNSAVAKSDTFDASIITARMNDSGYFAVATMARGYKAVVRVYSSAMQEIYQWYSADNRVLDVDVASNNIRVCITTLNTQGTTLLGGLTILDTGDTEPVASVVLSDHIIIRGAYKTGDTICAVSDAGLTFLDGKAKITGEYDFEGRFLKSFSVKPKSYTVLILGHNPIDEEVLLEAVDNKGKLMFSLIVPEGIKAMDANNDHVVAVTASRVLNLNYDGKIVEEIPLDNDVRAVCLAGGGAYLISPSSAKYIDLD